MSNDDKHLSDVGEDYIKCAEDAGGKPRLLAYNDGTGTWTGPWGITHGVVRGQRFTVAQAQALFDGEIAQCEAALKRLITREISQGLFDALISFFYNNGWGKCGTLINAVNSGNEQKIRAAWMLFVNARNENTGRLERWPGLVNRRNSELALWYKVDHDPDMVIDKGTAPEPAGTAEVDKKPVIATIQQSPSLRMQTGGFFAIVAGYFGDVMHKVSDGAQHLVSLIPGVSSDVQAVMTPAERTAQSLGIPWGSICLALGAVCILASIIRQLPNKQVGQ